MIRGEMTMPSLTFQEIDNHLMNDNKPSNFIIELNKAGIIETEYPFTLLGALKDTPQSPKHHPEGSV